MSRPPFCSPGHLFQGCGSCSLQGGGSTRAVIQPNLSHSQGINKQQRCVLRKRPPGDPDTQPAVIARADKAWEPLPLGVAHSALGWVWELFAPRSALLIKNTRSSSEKFKNQSCSSIAGATPDLGASLCGSHRFEMKSVSRSQRPWTSRASAETVSVCINTDSPPGLCFHTVNGLNPRMGKGEGSSSHDKMLLDIKNILTSPGWCSSVD